MTQTIAPPSDAGRTSALLVYGLYLLSIPSAGIFALLGVIIAVTADDHAGPLARSHLKDQARIWFISFWWHVALALLFLIGVPLSFILIGLPLLLLVGLGWLILMIWFTVKSALGMLALLDGRPR